MVQQTHGSMLSTILEYRSVVMAIKFAISIDSAVTSHGFGKDQRSLEWHKESHGRGSSSMESLTQMQKLDILVNTPCPDQNSPGHRGHVNSP